MSRTISLAGPPATGVEEAAEEVTAELAAAEVEVEEAAEETEDEAVEVTADEADEVVDEAAVVEVARDVVVDWETLEDEVDVAAELEELALVVVATEVEDAEAVEVVAHNMMVKVAIPDPLLVLTPHWRRVRRAFAELTVSTCHSITAHQTHTQYLNSNIWKR